MQFTVSLTIAATPETAALSITGIPWYPGITVLQAMIIGQTFVPNLKFRAVYNYPTLGAFIDSLNGVEDANSEFWLFSIDNSQSPVGVSEAILMDNPLPGNVDVEWYYGSGTASMAHRAQVAIKRGELTS